MYWNNLKYQSLYNTYSYDYLSIDICLVDTDIVYSYEDI